MLTVNQIILSSAILTLVIEGVTILLRFGFGLKSSRTTASTIGKVTRGIRIHHGYIGLPLIILAPITWSGWPNVSCWTLIVGISLLCSDLIHHFLVLRLITGDPEFDLFYH